MSNEKSAAAQELGKAGGDARARKTNKKQRQEIAKAGGNALASKFKTPEEKSAYYRRIQKKGVKARKAKMASENQVDNQDLTA
mgnify:CR=1 FL=1